MTAGGVLGAHGWFCPTEYDKIYDEAERAGVPVARWCRIKILEVIRAKQ